MQISCSRVQLTRRSQRRRTTLGWKTAMWVETETFEGFFLSSLTAEFFKCFPFVAVGIMLLSFSPAPWQSFSLLCRIPNYTLSFCPFEHCCAAHSLKRPNKARPQQKRQAPDLRYGGLPLSCWAGGTCFLKTSSRPLLWLRITETNCRSSGWEFRLLYGFDNLKEKSNFKNSPQPNKFVMLWARPRLSAEAVTVW